MMLTFARFIFGAVHHLSCMYQIMPCSDMFVVRLSGISHQPTTSFINVCDLFASLKSHFQEPSVGVLPQGIPQAFCLSATLGAWKLGCTHMKVRFL